MYPRGFNVADTVLIFRDDESFSKLEKLAEFGIEIDTTFSFKKPFNNRGPKRPIVDKLPDTTLLF